MAEPRTERIVSVDTLRGLVIALMIFVNDVAGVSGAPGWLKHVSAKFDGMTLPDIVFPAFLFLAGMSIPLALGREGAAAPSRTRRFGKVAGRTLVLLVMGVLMVNMETHDPWTNGAWGVFCYLGLFLAFAVVPAPPAPARRGFLIARAVGAVALIALALAYTDSKGRHLVFGPLFDSADSVWLRHSWWGILGLIGWAYFAAASLYLLIGRRREWLLGATVLLMLSFVAQEANYAGRLDSRAWLNWADGGLTAIQGAVGWVNQHVSLGEALGSLASVAMAGCCLGSILLPSSGISAPSERMRWAGLFALGLLLGALLFDGTYGINKIGATPTWCWLCAALTTLAWILLYWMMDTRNVRRWSGFLQPAGANPLLAYVLHPSLYLLTGVVLPPLNALLGLNLRLDFYKERWFDNAGLSLALNLLGCAGMVLGVIWLTGRIVRLGYRLKA